jgi:carbonic anhydrase
MKSRRSFIAIMIAALLYSIPVGTAFAAGCPKEPDWGYMGPNGPQNWNTLFPFQCGTGTRQSPINILPANATPARLPKLVFHYRIAHVVELDHDDQIQFNHGAGNYITIGNTRYDLVNIHEHTPAEYTLNGHQYPMEIHLVHVNQQTGALAVVGVLVQAGKADPGVIEPPSLNDPSGVDLFLPDLLPRNREYVRFNGSLTTPGNTTTPPRCAEGVLWTEMLHPITMSSDQIKDFEDAAQACWGTSVTNRPVQPTNNRFILRAIPAQKSDP